MNSFASVLDSIFGWILQASWQAAVLVMLVLCAQWVFRNRLSPAWRYGLWMLVVVRLLVPVSPQSAVSIFNLARLNPARLESAPLDDTESGASAPKDFATPDPFPPNNSMTVQPKGDSHRAHVVESRAVANPGEAPATPIQPIRSSPIQSMRFAALVWLAVAGLLLLRLIWAQSVLRARLKGHAQVQDPRLVPLIAECCARMGVDEPITIVETKLVQSPAVCGLLKKWLLLPAGFANRFSDAELRHVLLHEFAHLKRRDLEVHWLMTILQALHWFNPVVWFAFGRMRADRELATDTLALARVSASDNLAYGETILKVVEGITRSAARPGMVGIAESKAQLKERLRAIARAGSDSCWRWAAIGLLGVLAGVGLTDAQTAKPATPVPAQAPETLEPGQRSYALRVVDFETGVAVPGVRVDWTLEYHGGGSRTIQSATDQDGLARMMFATLNLKHVAYRTEKPNYLSLQGDWHEQEARELNGDFTIKLSRGIEIGGLVTDESGKPVQGAEISFDQPINMLLNANSGALHAQRWSAPSDQSITVTGVDGRWAARCIQGGLQWASLRIHHPDFADVTCSTELTAAMEAAGKGVRVSFEDLKNKRVHLKLPKGNPIRGLVVDETDKPAQGIHVKYAELLSEPNSRDQLLGVRELVSDRTGAFSIPHAPSKPMLFFVQEDGYAPMVLERAAQSSAADVELKLSKGVRLTGSVVDAQTDQPLSGARLEFADFGVWRGIRHELSTDELGRFEWEHAPAERFQFRIKKDGYITLSKSINPNPATSLKIRLNQTLHITGNVVDATTKRPLERFVIDWSDRFDPSELEQGYNLTTLSFSNGVYSLEVGRLYGDTWSDGYAHSCLFRVRADGYASQISRVFLSRSNDVGHVTYNLELLPVSQLTGIVSDAAERPVAGAQVALKLAASRLMLSGKPTLTSTVSGCIQLTDDQGRFRLNAESGSQGLIVVHPQGVAEVSTNEFGDPLKIRLQPWSRIEGTVWEYGQTVTNQQIWMSAMGSIGPETFRAEFRTDSDGQGRFTFDFVPPGKYMLYRMIPRERGGYSGPSQTVRVQPGASVAVKLGGEGRPVIGQFKITNPYVLIDWPGVEVYAHSVLPRWPSSLKTREEIESWRRQPEVEQAFDSVRNYPIRIAPDGSFRMDEVLPGQYQLQLRILDPRDSSAFAYSKHIADVSKSFEVPKPAKPADESQPLDIGTVEVTLKPEFQSGKTDAPAFEATDLNGKKLQLSDYRGKYVLLDFWATWCGPCIGQLSYLKQVHEKFKDRPDFVLLSLSLDKSADDLRTFLKKENLPWTQGYLGDWSSTDVPSSYGVRGIPAVFLIDPQGKVVESDLEGGTMILKLQQHLK